MKRKITLGLSIWLLITLLLGGFEVFSILPRQFFGISVFVTVTTVTLLYFKNKNSKEFVDSISLKQIALVHIFRIIAGLLFLYYSDNLPEAFVSKASYGDIISGLLAILALLFNRKFLHYIFHLFGLIDLITALSIGTYFNIIGNSKMATIFYLPLILIPLFIVPILLVTHISSLKKLNQKNYNENI
ncbi:Probable transmembrane protein of unknown function [Flavobacterium indicum GPTSA100-9 = DSM 17447]|uniref:Uncharacterized protein n=1 Tax=Flavobacterium indicum (strain DSM 17447 / CIP 109464 / GPTSA100-9) TaxID=1094466 RepID=H8XTM2_FLAIG|nr:hypothetical protein [Flavobacterium indicum]CCG53602.1 Probable transmembrane protein of unknown function [Flavobacterium indicum GPTSA100-9 = DSM 17447]